MTFFVTEVGDIFIEDLSRAHVELYIDAIYKSGLANRTISNRIDFVRTFLLTRKLGHLIVLYPLTISEWPPTLEFGNEPLCHQREASVYQTARWFLPRRE